MINIHRNSKTFFTLFWLRVTSIIFCCPADIFSQISDSSGVMVFAKFDQFLREVLKLPTAVFEGPSFGYTEHSVRTCFPQQVGSPSLSSVSSSNNYKLSFNNYTVHVCVCF